jgi:RNA polymerase sigma factor (sigma-70 family)
VQLPPFQEFFDSHRTDVYRFLVGIAGRQDADDLFQETFLAALRAYPTLRDATNLRSWVLTIAHHKAIDSFRASARRPRPTDELPERPAPAPPDGEPQLWNDVRTLPPKQRAAVLHRFVHDLPYDEIGTLLDCSPEAARRSVHEGVTKLRTAWQT